MQIQEGTDYFYSIPNRFVPAREPLTCARAEGLPWYGFYLNSLAGRVKRIINCAKKAGCFFKKRKAALAAKQYVQEDSINRMGLPERDSLGKFGLGDVPDLSRFKENDLLKMWNDNGWSSSRYILGKGT